jgi:Cys-tRNA(Pro)/Cys-tRNA(Cys) deacylase
LLLIFSSVIIFLEPTYFGDETMDIKTNVMRLLEGARIPYQAHRYPDDHALSGVEVAALLNLPEERVFKTLVTVGKPRQYYVFMVPVAQELNLKKAAQAAGEKSVEMIKARELLPLTGYVHGGCSPIGMKKLFQTFMDDSAQNSDTIVFSAGKIGFQVELPLLSLQALVPVTLASLV